MFGSCNIKVCNLGRHIVSQLRFARETRQESYSHEFFFQFDIYNRRIRKIPKSKFELRCGTSAEKCNRFCDVHWCIVFYTRNREINKLVTGSLGKNELYHKRVVLKLQDLVCNLSFRYVSLQLRMQNRRRKWNFPLNFCTMHKLYEHYSRIFQNY